MAALPGGGFGFWLRWADFAPEWDPAWHWATDHARRAFRDEAARFAADAWRQSRSLGLDRFGRRMRPIGHKTRLARRLDVNRVTAEAPYSPMGRANEEFAALQATGPNSRTQTLLRWKPAAWGIWFYWATDPHTGQNWGAVLDRHRQGYIRYFRFPRPAGYERVPARDVFGFSPAEIGLIEQHMGRWWMLRRHLAATLRVLDLPEEGLAIPMPVGPARVVGRRAPPAVAPARRRVPPGPLPRFTTITTRAGSVSGSGAGILPAGRQIARFELGNKAPAWMRRGR